MNRAQVLQEASQQRQQAQAATLRGRLDLSREILRSLIGLLESSLPEDPSTSGPSTSRNEVARALADAYGMLGGVERRRGARAEALAAYERGRAIEQNPQFEIVDSYNLVNELVSKILLDPKSLGELADQLAGAASVVRAQVRGPRRDQWWAWADAALLELLVGDEEAAGRAYDSFVKNGPKPSNYRSVADVLTELEAKLAPVEPATAERLRAAAADVLSWMP